jgi:hypothetical protein
MSFDLAKIPHCDIRPSTIFVTQKGSFALTDINFLYDKCNTPYKETVFGNASAHRLYLAPEKVTALLTR